MTALKPSRGGSLVTAVILGGSLLLNFYLLRRSGSVDRAATAERVVRSSATAAPATAPKGLTSTAIVTGSDLATLRDALIAAGASDTRVREIMWGAARWQFRDEQTKKRLARIERGWWKDEQRAMGITRSRQWLVDDPGLLRELVYDRVESLVGIDPAERQVVNARYAFLPEELRVKFDRVQRDLARDWVGTGDPEIDAKTAAEMAVKAREYQAEREQLLASLTPDQRREYDMYYGSLGRQLASALGGVQGSTEEEFRKIYRIAEETMPSTASAAVAGTATLVNGAISLDGARSFVAPSQEAVVERMVSEFGYDRAMDYLWAQTPEYRAVSILAKENNLDPTAAARFTQLAAETGAKAAAIHQDGSLSVEQHRAALLALQQTARAQADALVPPEAQQKLPPTALQWLTQMSEGRYKMMTPGMPGRGSASFTGSITAPNPALPAGFSIKPPVRPTP
jgi:hypothetical protein